MTRSVNHSYGGRPRSAGCWPALIAAALCCLPPAVAGALPVQPFKAHFDVYYRGLPIGAGVIELSDTGDGRYQISSDVEATGLARLIYPYKVSGLSRGTFVNGVPQPSTYRQFQAVAGEEHVSRASFNWSNRRVKAQFDDRQRSLKLRPRVVDPLSLFALAMGDLKRGTKTAKYRLINRIYVSSYRVVEQREQVLETPLGKINTWRVSRQRKGSHKRTTLWFARDWHYIPVQVVYAEHGSEKIRLTVERLER